MSIRPGKAKAPYVGPALSSMTGDHKVLVDATDSTPDYLKASLIAGPNITLSTVNIAGDHFVEIEAATSPDIKAKVSAADTTADYLNSKIVAGTNVTKAILNPGVNETLEISASDTQVKASAGDTTPSTLDNKMVAGANIVITKLNPGGNESLSIAAAAAALDYKFKTTAADTTPNYAENKILAGSGITITKENAGANEDLKISLTTAVKTTSKFFQSYAPDSIQIDSGAIGNMVCPTGGNFRCVVMPGGAPENIDSTLHFGHFMHPAYDGTGITMRVHWSTIDPSHSTAHDMKYSARYFRNTDTLNVAQALNVWTFQAETADYLGYVESKALTIEGTYAAAGCLLYVRLVHLGTCAASEHIKVLACSLEYNITL